MASVNKQKFVFISWTLSENVCSLVEDSLPANSFPRMLESRWIVSFFILISTDNQFGTFIVCAWCLLLSEMSLSCGLLRHQPLVDHLPYGGLSIWNGIMHCRPVSEERCSSSKPFIQIIELIKYKHKRLESILLPRYLEEPGTSCVALGRISSWD